ncbi:MAG: RsiV family protein [Actinomycetota bacterium]|nr:RsiV family protein [Actinomycetota bacterium]
MRRASILISVATTAILITAAASSTNAATPEPSPTPSASQSQGQPTSFTITKHSKKVKGFTTFTYQTGTINPISGTSSTAMAKMNELLSFDVLDTMRSVKNSRISKCTMNRKSCGYFIQTITAPTCKAGSVCITQPASMLRPGANTGDAWVNTAVFDSTTGARQQIDAFISPSQEAAFLKGANAGITAALIKGGIKATDPMWRPSLEMPEVYAWIPTPEGMHLYFSKYNVAPGSFGVVDFTVPWTTINA